MVSLFVALLLDEGYVAKGATTEPKLKRFDHSEYDDRN